MHIITKQFAFEAAHRLLGHPKCGRLHGHSYRVEVELKCNTLHNAGPMSGMVRDYADLAPIKQFIDEKLDHRYLVSQELDTTVDKYAKIALEEGHGVFLGIPRSTAECMARYLYQEFKDMYPELTAVRVSETANTWAEYRFERGLC